MMPSGSIAKTAVVVAASALVVGAAAARGSRVAEVAVVAAVAFAVGCWVVSSRDPRRAGVMTIAVLVPAAVATGIHAAGPIPLSALVPTTILMVTLLPGVARGSDGRPREIWGLAVVAVLSIGGMSATAAGGGSWTAVGGFLISTLPAIVAIWRLDPDRGEMRWIVLGLLVGVTVSTFLGIVALRYPSGRAVGLTHHPNQFALQIAVAVPLLALLWSAGTVRTWLAVVVAAILALGELQSGSRSGALALALVLAVLLWRTVRPLAMLGAALVFGSVLFLFGIPSSASPTVARLTESNLTQNSDTARIALADKGLAQVKLDPVFGTGLPKTALPHNVILLVWGGMGFIGLLALLVLVWFIVSGALGRPRGLERWLLSVSTLGFLVVVSLNNSIGTPVAWVILGLLQTGLARSQRVQEPAAPPPAPVSAAPPTGLGSTRVEQHAVV